MTFTETLRHSVRQDPDIIVMGEVRDTFSAETAIQASLTGHKVLTTFHTEDAVGARWLAIRCGYQGLSEQAYLDGLLHDIAKHLLIAALKEIVRCGEFSIKLSDSLVVEVLATMHIEQGV